MKKITLALFSMLFIFCAAQAQINKGSVLVGGSVGVISEKSDAQKNTQVNISPSLGVALRQNLIGGVFLNYGSVKNNGAIYSPSRQHSYGGGVFLRKYNPLGRGFYFFWEPRIGYYYAYSKSPINGPISTDFDITKTNSVYLGLGAGVSYAISKKFQLELSLPQVVNASYGTLKETSAGNVLPERHTFQANVYASPVQDLQVGFRFLFMK